MGEVPVLVAAKTTKLRANHSKRKALGSIPSKPPPKKDLTRSLGWDNGGGVPPKGNSGTQGRQGTACAEALRPGQPGTWPAGSSYSAIPGIWTKFRV